jgi:type IV secretion system protein VirB3
MTEVHITSSIMGSVPIHLALTEPMLSMGMPRNYLICVWGMTVALLLGAHNWVVLPRGVVLHLLEKWATKYDPQFVEVLVWHLRYKAQYH